jgi:ElaB/YqjD/DUF883 family membrane-anchored ribosome-binding protein
VGTRAEELRTDIARTRGELSETFDAMGDRVSPRRMVERRSGRVRIRMLSWRDAVMGSPYQPGLTGRASGAASDALSNVGDVGASVVQRAQDAPEMASRQVRGNPLAAGLVAFGGGLLLATLLPPSEQERHLAGTVGEQVQPVVGHAKEAAREVSSAVQDHAKAAAGEVTDHARGAAREVQQQAAEHSQQVGQQARDAAQQVRDDARSGRQPGTP